MSATVNDVALAWCCFPVDALDVVGGGDVVVAGWVVGVLGVTGGACG